MRNIFTFLTISLCALSSMFAQLNPVQIGRSANAFTALRTNQNQVYACDSTNTVAFIHRQDISIWGGTTMDNGRLRYDLSTDGGATFTSDIGEINPMYTPQTRYPQITGLNFSGSTNPFSQKFAWIAPTTNGTNWTSFGVGLLNASTNADVVDEQYAFLNQVEFQGGGLCQGRPGELWFVSRQSGSSNLEIMKASVQASTTSLSWQVDTVISFNHNILGTGALFAGENISFSPNGETGWAAILGDLAGGQDSSVLPVLVPSFDGGNSWGAPIEVDLSAIQYETFDGKSLYEDLTAFWRLDSVSPAATGVPTCGFQFDLIVDKDGNPHIFTIVGSRPGGGVYVISAGFEKYAVDIYSEDRGQSWKAVRVSPVLTFNGTFGLPGNDISQDNYPQISRSPDGSRIFYSWADTDTTLNFGNASNQSPELCIASRRLSDGFMSCPRWVTHNTTYQGTVISPTMAPEVLVDAGGNGYRMPVVVTSLFSQDPYQPCEFLYFGNDASINESDYLAPASRLDIQLFSSQFPTCQVRAVGIEEISASGFRVYPNPSSGQVRLDLENLPVGEYTLNVIALDGKTVHSQPVQNRSTSLDLSHLPKGIYYLNLKNGEALRSRKVVLR
ncbi:MAG: T9SS type A sorting domain-containing protein [Bacteroidia bacterium]